MGMFRTVIHPDDGRELQFKTGNDFCQTYRVGDTVDWTADPYWPGSGIDDVYETWSSEGRDCWVIIKDCKVVAVEPCCTSTDADDRYEQHQALTLKYDIQPPDRKLWTDEQWAAKRQREDESDARFALWQQKSGKGDATDTIMYNLHCMLNGPSYRDFILPVKKVTLEHP